jgi:hypothetical protein
MKMMSVIRMIGCMEDRKDEGRLKNDEWEPKIFYEYN